MKDFIAPLSLILIIIFFLIGSFIIGMLFLEKTIFCPKFGKAVELESKYIFFGGGCFVKTEKGQWIQGKNYWNSLVKN